ncbi:MAG: DEAD/DEAH box helicase [Kiritimatiellae bacterium]|nr:DEAD/DEAH box helicase [Kiritimatiellia bacterium]
MDLFEQLRSPQHLWRNNSSIPVGLPYFIVKPCEGGATLTVCDKKGDLWEHSHQFYQGALRAALGAVESLQEHHSFGFTWEGDSNEILLHENPHLLPLLERTGRLFNADQQPLTFTNKPGKVSIVVERQGALYAANVRVQCGNELLTQYELLTDIWILADKTRIIKTLPLGPNFHHLPSFATYVGEDELSRYLTLLFSTLSEIALDFEDYTLIEGEAKNIENCLIFEECDEEGNLKLRMSSSLSGFDPDFIENYEISRIATINEMERRVTVSCVTHQPLKDCVNRIERGLKGVLSTGGSYFREDNFFLVSAELAVPFLERVLPQLLTHYACYGAENLKRFKLRTSKPKIVLGSIKSGIDFLDTSINIVIDDQTIALSAALEQFRKNRYIALNDGSRAIINEDYIKRLERIFRRKKKRGADERISFFDLPMLEDMLDESDQQRISEMAGIAEIKKALTSTKLVPLPQINATLRPYQHDGYQWLTRLYNARLGGCLADDMGLGKTLQAITLLQATSQPDSPPSLVVMPRTLIFNWQKEIEKFAPELTFAVHHGPGRDLKGALQSRIILTTYGTLRSDIELFQEERFHYLILDESQNIKNPGSQAAKAVLLVNSNHRLALSGTPVENNLTELYSLFRFLNPAMFDSLQSFTKSYTLPISKDNDRQAMWELQRKIAPFILRRTKKEVLKELPDKVEQILYTDMSDQQAALYESRRRYYQDLISGDLKSKGLNNCQFMILQAFTELRQIASNPSAKTDGAIISAKRELVVSELTDAIANGHKCLLFANFIGTLEGLSEDLQAAGIEHVMMTGATRDRESLVEMFQNDNRVKVFLMTLKTGGVGLNLTAADYVFIYDPWWNLAAELQAIDRTHRIGQQSTVFTYKLVMRNTIEEKILLLQQQKGELFNDLIGADSATLKSFTEADIQFALGVGS